MSVEFGSPEAGAGSQVAASLVSVALERGWLDIVEGGDVADLEEATNAAEFGPNPDARARAVMDVWLHHEAVDEVYVSDEDLVAFLAKW